MELYAVPAEFDDCEPVPQIVLLGNFGVKLSGVLLCVGHMVVRGSQEVGWPQEVVPFVGYGTSGTTGVSPYTLDTVGVFDGR